MNLKTGPHFERRKFLSSFTHLFPLSHQHPLLFPSFHQNQLSQPYSYWFSSFTRNYLTLESQFEPSFPQAVWQSLRSGVRRKEVQPLDSGSKTHPFPHTLVAGIERYKS
ncbi:hypothetical protein BDR22DRAFT_546911 [Usnea florida]